MRVLSKDEMENIDGGGLSSLLIGGIIGAIYFIAGFLDGFTRPYSCR